MACGYLAALVVTLDHVRAGVHSSINADTIRSTLLPTLYNIGNATAAEGFVLCPVLVGLADCMNAGNRDACNTPTKRHNTVALLICKFA